MYFIQEADKPLKIFRWLNYIRIKDDILILPICDAYIKMKKAEKLAKKAKKIIELSNCKKVVISKKIEKQENFLNYLYSYNIDIINGKWLFEILIYDVLEYIIKKKKMMKENIRIAVLSNQITENVIYIIKKIVKEYKMINVVTNHIELFKNLERQIMDNYGVMIALVNNKKKSLLKSDIIVNFDFTNEIINKYNINENATVVNLQGNIKIKSKKFNGLNINDYEIQVLNSDFFDYDKSKKYKEKYLYEAELNKRQPIDEIRKKIKKDKVIIKELIGINNVI